MTKVKLVLEVEVDLDITQKEASRIYKDAMWPLEALALDRVSAVGVFNLISDKQIIVRDVFVDGAYGDDDDD
jgi:hypothetical protein